MRKLLAFGVVVAAMLSAPAVSQGHVGSADVDCTTATFKFKYFPPGSNAFLAVWIDGAVTSGNANNLGQAESTHTMPVSVPADGVAHQVYAATAWNADGGGYSKSRTVTCSKAPPPPAPIPTPATPAPPPAPTPAIPAPAPVPLEVSVGCDGKPMAPGAPAPECKPPRTVCPNSSRYQRNDYRLSWVPLHARTGYVTFRLHGPNAKGVRWYVAGERRGMYRYEHVWSSGRRFTLPVWSREAWPRLPGTHTVSAHFRTPCGKQHIAVSYPNIDP